MGRIYGRQCTLTLLVDDETPVALPYCEETIREAATGTFAACPNGCGNRAAFAADGIEVAGCFITRLDSVCCVPLFRLLQGRQFSLVHNQGGMCRKYGNLAMTEFSLFAERGEAFYFRAEICGGGESAVTDCEPEESLAWKARRTFRLSGKDVEENGKTIPLVHRMEMKISFKKEEAYELYIYAPFSDRFFPSLDEVESVRFALSRDDGIFLELHDLVPRNDLRDIVSADCVLVRKRFAVNGRILLSYNEDGAECALEI